MEQTPKEYAEELVNKMYLVHSNSASGITMYFAKQCALIAVDELIKEKTIFEPYGSRIGWFEEIKNEINKL